jgi:hypothetical protein
MVGDRRDQSNQRSVVEDGRDHVDVGQMCPAGERVVQDDDVARVEIVRECPEDGCDGIWDGTQLVG